MKTLIITALVLTSIMTNAQKKLYFNQITTREVNLKTKKERNVESYDVNNSYLLWSEDKIYMFIHGELISGYDIVDGSEYEKGKFELYLNSNNQKVILYWSHESPYVVLFYPQKKNLNKNLVVEIRMDNNLLSQRHKKENIRYTNL